MSSIEDRIRHLEDLEAIRYLKHYHYCHCLDRLVAGDSNGLADTLSRVSETIVADFTGGPLIEGKAAFTGFLTLGVPAALSWSQHRVMNEVIDIEGDRARARWYLACPVRFKEGGSTGLAGAGFIEGRYDEELVREDGVWKWARITALLDVQADYAHNWQNASYVFANR